MKVSTDACIQGAWAAHALESHPIQNVLDIGTGTGLLSLMLAQVLHTAKFTAIEINEDAFLQARDNFGQSPWRNRLQVRHQSLQEYSTPDNRQNSQGSYDLVICNPPFFHNQLPSLHAARKDARHSPALSKDDLAKASDYLLKTDGMLCVLYPDREWEAWNIIAEKYHLYPLRLVYIHPGPGKKPNRLIGLYSRQNTHPCKTEELIIYNSPKNYTKEFTDLLHPYYLAL